MGRRKCAMKATLLATPTAELVRIRCDEFDRDPSTHLAEDALGQLWVQFPRNTETAHVLLKVLALNKLNSTQVRDIDVEILARHIAGIGIDPLLAEGSPSTVDLITNCVNLRNYFSFASKYCSWHNPDTYPIYDSRVDECLWSYQKRDGFAKAKFLRKDLWGYPGARIVRFGFVCDHVTGPSLSEGPNLWDPIEGAGGEESSTTPANESQQHGTATSGRE
jgi:hypothetical protein